MIVYKITNLVNGKIYIGQTMSFRARFSEHGRAKDIRRSALHRAIKKYGWDKFVMEPLVENIETKECADAIEIDFIRNLRSMDRSIGYNLTCGGGGATGWKHSMKARELMSAQRKGKPTSPSAMRELLRYAKMKKDETFKRLCSDGCKVRGMNPEYRKKMSLATKGKKKSAEHVAALKLAFKKRRDKALKVEHEGVVLTMAEWGSLLGVSAQAMRYRINHWGVEKAMSTPFKRGNQ